MNGNALRLVFRRFFRRRALERELNEEFASHIAMETSLRMKEGDPPVAARQAALGQFGNQGLVAEVTRNKWRFSWLEQGLNDIWCGIRSFARVPLFSVIVIVTLTLGIGSSTAIFSLLHGILLQALPFPQSDRLVMLWEVPPKTQKPNVVWLNNFDAWKKRSRSFQSLAAFDNVPMNLLGERDNEQVPGLKVTAEFFTTLGTAPLLGRTFLPAWPWGRRTPASFA